MRILIKALQKNGRAVQQGIERRGDFGGSVVGQLGGVVVEVDGHAAGVGGDGRRQEVIKQVCGAERCAPAG